MAHGNELYLATLVSGRYANPDHSSAVIRTLEFGNVACSDADFSYLWERRGEIEMAPFEAGAQPEPAPENREVEADGHVALVPSDEPTHEGGAEPAAPPPLPDAEDDPLPSMLSHAPGDWKKAIAAMQAGPEEDFSIGLEMETEPLEEPAEDVPEPVVEAPPLPRGEPLAKTVIISEQKTIDDSSWGRAEIAYQVAIQAKNGSAVYRGLLREPAARRGMSVEELADEIIHQRLETVQRVMGEF